MRIRTLALVVGVVLPTLLCAQETYAFIARLGRDTIAVERITRTADRVTSDLVEQSPRVLRKHWQATLARDGSMKEWTLDVTVMNPVPNRPTSYHYVVRFDNDSLKAVVRVGDSTRTETLARHQSIAVPWDSFIYGAYEQTFAAALRVHSDTVAVEHYFPGYQPLETAYVSRSADGTVSYWSPKGLAGVGKATVDARGRMLSYSGKATTFKHEVERVAQAPDIDQLTARFAVREKARGITQVLSARDTARGTVGNANLMVDYGRPTARGRVIAGGVLPYGEVWRTGANAATQFFTTAPITLAGVELAAGAYTLWTIPAPSGATLIINRQFKQWGTQYDVTQDIARVPQATVQAAPAIDTFTVHLEATSASTGTLVLAWDTFRWTAPITVKLSPQAGPEIRNDDISAETIVRSWTFTNRSGAVVRDTGAAFVRLDARSNGGMVWTKDLNFRNGDIEFDARGQDVQQRSFPGVAFHIVDEGTFDVVWLRPFNFRAADPARRPRSVQFASYPEFSWQRLREEHPGAFEAAVPADIDPNGWVHVHVEVRDSAVRVFLNYAATPVLAINSPSRPAGGGLGLWVGDQSPGDFANLRVRRQ